MTVRSLALLLSLVFSRCMASESQTCAAFLQKDGSVALKTPYGRYTVREPVLVDLIKSKPLLRLKSVYFGGISALVIEKQPKRTRLDHSAGVLALLRRYRCPLIEQVAGLAHDLSHGAFSHVLDFVLRNPAQQDEQFESFIEKTTIPSILAAYNIRPHEINSLKQDFPGLKQKAPNLCADILEGILGDSLAAGFFGQSDVDNILTDLQFDGQNWVFRSQGMARQLGDASLYTVEKIYANRANYMAYYWTAEALKKAAELKIISHDDMRTGTDKKMWHTLKNIDDGTIQGLVSLIKEVESIALPGSQANYDMLVSTKFRCVDPLVKTETGFKRLSELDENFKNEFEGLRQRLAQGLPTLLSKKEGQKPQAEIFAV